MDLEKEAANIKVDTSILGNISEACNKLLDVQTQIEKCEDHLKLIKENARVLSEETIPDLMNQSGMKKVVLEDDSTVEVRPFLTAKIPQSKIEEAYKWLVDNNLGDIIKNEVTLKFNKSENAVAEAVASDLRHKGHEVHQKQKVEHQTLKATAREQERLGKPMPMDLFGVYTTTQTKIITKKGTL